jgi:hypothetical protein
MCVLILSTAQNKGLEEDWTVSTGGTLNVYVVIY